MTLASTFRKIKSRPSRVILTSSVRDPWLMRLGMVVVLLDLLFSPSESLSMTNYLASICSSNSNINGHSSSSSSSSSCKHGTFRTTVGFSTTTFTDLRTPTRNHPAVQIHQHVTLTQRRTFLFMTKLVDKEFHSNTKESVLLNRNGSTDSSSSNNILKSSYVYQPSWIQDTVTMMSHVIFCTILAILWTLWEGIDCTYLKPLPATIRHYPGTVFSKVENNENAYNDPISSKDHVDSLSLLYQLMKTSTRGMGRGAVDRLDGWYQDTYWGIPSSTTPPTTTIPSPSSFLLDNAVDRTEEEYSSLQNIPSYNEIMLNHREKRVPLWKKDISQQDVRDAVEGILEALETLQEVKVQAQDYQWDEMRYLLRGPVLTHHLEQSCSVLQQAKDFLSVEARQEIGFDWGSCAWRRCGAQADAQESLAELYNSVGLFEPFECLFTIDIVERSLRDILMVVPIEYKPPVDVIVRRIGEYIPYEPVNGGGNSYDDDDERFSNSSIDQDYMNALEELRSNIFNDNSLSGDG